jgi:hypothetical protein
MEKLTEHSGSRYTTNTEATNPLRERSWSSPLSCLLSHFLSDASVIVLWRAIVLFFMFRIIPVGNSAEVEQ